MYIARGQFVYEGDRALYMDDILVHSIMTNPETSLLEKITDTTANKNRYLANILMVTSYSIVGQHYERIDTLQIISNIVLMIIIWSSIFYSIRTHDIIKKQLITLGGVLVFISSRFAYYGYEEVLGQMESLATGLTMIFLCLLWNDKFQCTKRFWIANFVYLCLIFTHERFAVLAAVLVAYCFLALLYTNQRRLKRAFVLSMPSVLLFLFFILLRIMLFKRRFLDGTAGTDAISTFSLGTFFTMLKKSFLYLAGINVPNEVYLNGVDPRMVPAIFYFFTVLTWLFIIGTITIYIKDTHNRKKEYLKYVFCLTAAILLVAISSATIRVEMRWMYAPLAIMIFAFANMYATVIDNDKQKKREPLIAVGTCIVLLILITENYYSRKWANLYNWSSRIDACELSNELDNCQHIETLYIITKQASNSDEAFIRNLATTERKDIDNIVFLDDITAPDYISPHDMVLLRNDETFDYTNVTELYKISTANKNIYGVRKVSGFYDDGWMSDSATLLVRNKNNAELSLTFYNPVMDVGDDELHICVNEEEILCVPIQSGLWSIHIPIKADEFAKILLKTDYRQHPTNGDERELSLLVSDMQIAR